MMIYHITAKTEWEKAQAAGAYRADSLATEGFIHASTREQVVDTGSRYYRGQSGLVLLCIDTDKVGPEVRFELSPAINQQFPHIYGPLNIDAVVAVVDFPANSDGSFALPQNLI